MPGISRVGQDRTGAIIQGMQNTTVFANGSPVAVLGDSIPTYGDDCSNPKMRNASSTVFAGGIPVCRAGDQDSCGTPSTGSGTVISG